MTTCRSSYTEVLRNTRAYLLLLCVSYSAVKYCIKSQRSAAQMSGAHDAEPREDIASHGWGRGHACEAWEAQAQSHRTRGWLGQTATTQSAERQDMQGWEKRRRRKMAEGSVEGEGWQMRRSCYEEDGNQLGSQVPSAKQGGEEIHAEGRVKRQAGSSMYEHELSDNRAINK